MKYFQRLNWNFFIYFWRWGEFFSKHTQFTNSVWKMAHVGNLSISETFPFLCLVVVYINFFSCFQWEHFIQGLCDKQELNCMGLFLHVLKYCSGHKRYPDNKNIGNPVDAWKRLFLRPNPGAYCPMVSTNEQAVHLKEWQICIVGIWNYPISLFCYSWDRSKLLSSILWLIQRFMYSKIGQPWPLLILN